MQNVRNTTAGKHHVHSNDNLLRLNYTQDIAETLGRQCHGRDLSSYRGDVAMTVSLCHCHVGENISVVTFPTVHAAKSEICLKQSAYDFNVPTEDAKHIKCIMY